MIMYLVVIATSAVQAHNKRRHTNARAQMLNVVWKVRRATLLACLCIHMQMKKEEKEEENVN